MEGMRPENVKTVQEAAKEAVAAAAAATTTNASGKDEPSNQVADLSKCSDSITPLTHAAVAAVPMRDGIPTI